MLVHTIQHVQVKGKVIVYTNLYLSHPICYAG